MKQYAITLLVFLSLLAGCAPRETFRVLGIGTERFLSEGKVYEETMPLDFLSCYSGTVAKLKRMRAQVYRAHRKKGFIIATGFDSAFNQCINSTEVAVFFTEISPNETKVTVSSLNYSLSEFVAQKLFAALEQPASASEDEEDTADNETQP